MCLIPNPIKFWFGSSNDSCSLRECVWGISFKSVNQRPLITSVNRRATTSLLPLFAPLTFLCLHFIYSFLLDLDNQTPLNDFCSFMFSMEWHIKNMKKRDFDIAVANFSKVKASARGLNIHMGIELQALGKENYKFISCKHTRDITWDWIIYLFPAFFSFLHLGFRLFTGKKSFPLVFLGHTESSLPRKSHES